MMKIQFENPTGLTDHQLELIEGTLGRQLPVNIRTFYKEYAGARPTINGKTACFNITLPSGRKISSFIESIDSHESLSKHISNMEYLTEYVEHFNLDSNYVQTEFLFPIANLPNGAVYASIDGKHKGKIYTADAGDFGIVFHSNSLEQFLDSIYEI